jgi:hypothetical protein
MRDKIDDAITAAVRNVFNDNSAFYRIDNNNVVYGWVGEIEGKKIGIAVATKSQRFASSTDHILNKNDLDQLIAALDAGRRDQAFVVSANINQSGKFTFVSMIEARELAAILANVTPRSGPLGEFFLVKPHFTSEGF